MDDATVIRSTEAFQRNWNAIPKQVITKASKGKQTLISFALELEGLHVQIACVIGVRGGLSLDVIVIDPGKPIVIDRAILMEKDPLVAPVLLHLQGVKEEIRHGADPVACCEAAMGTLLTKILSRPAFYAALLRSPREPFSTTFIQGGAPGLGKRS